MIPICMEASWPLCLHAQHLNNKFPVDGLFNSGVLYPIYLQIVVELLEAILMDKQGQKPSIS